MNYQKTLVIGLGNPILGDDGIGWVIAEQLAQEIDDPNVDVQCFTRGGLYLMERLIGYDRAILIDALFSSDAEPGSVSQFPLEDLPILEGGHTRSPHDTSLQIAIESGRHLGLDLPSNIQIVAITSQNVSDFSEKLTPPMTAAIRRARQIVLDILDLPLIKEVEYDLS
jgi:hydrogenase maturation protease